MNRLVGNPALLLWIAAGAFVLGLTTGTGGAWMRTTPSLKPTITVKWSRLGTGRTIRGLTGPNAGGPSTASVEPYGARVAFFNESRNSRIKAS